MKTEECLLVTAMEECAEIQQEISKALRFGVESHHPDNSEMTHGKLIMKEFYQLRAVMDMLVVKRIIPPISEFEQNQIYRDKWAAVEKWEAYSKSIGSVS